MKSLFITTIILLIAGNLQAQHRSDVYDNIADWSRDNKARQIINAYQENPEVSFQGDSLSWFLYYTGHAFIQTGDYDQAKQLITKAFNKIDDLKSDDLKIRLIISKALILKKESKYKQSIEYLNTAKPLIKQRIKKYKYENYPELLYQELEKLTTLYINKSTSYFYLGEIENYGELTKKALITAIKNGNRRQELLARRNLIEYFEITEQWKEAAYHLHSYSIDIEIYGSPTESERYKLRAAIYERDKLEDIETATRMLTEILETTEELKAFQIWEEALYELLHTYIQQQQHQQALDLIHQSKTSPLAGNNINTLSLLRARSLQLHIYTDQLKEAEKDYKALQIINTNLSNSQVQSVATHAIIMYLTQTDNKYTARLLLRQLVEKSQKNEAKHQNNPRNIEYIIMQRYTDIKYAEENSELSHEQVIDRLLQKYRSNEIKEWWMQTQSNYLYFVWIFGGVILISTSIGFLYYKRKRDLPDYIGLKKIGSQEYQSIKSRINYI